MGKRNRKGLSPNLCWNYTKIACLLHSLYPIYRYPADNQLRSFQLPWPSGWETVVAEFESLLFFMCVCCRNILQLKAWSWNHAFLGFFYLFHAFPYSVFTPLVWLHDKTASILITPKVIRVYLGVEGFQRWEKHETIDR